MMSLGRHAGHYHFVEYARQAPSIYDIYFDFLLVTRRRH